MGTGEDRDMKQVSGTKRKRLLFVYNPKAGKGTVVKHLHEIVDIFVKAKYLVTVYPTQKRGDACKLMQSKEAERYHLIVCSGGDGTLREVVDGLLRSEKDVPLGYIPTGSTNDFARSLGLSEDILKAAKNIARGEVFSCDSGKFNGKNFVYIAAFGLFTDVSYATNQQFKNIFGHAAYILQGAKSLSSIKSYHVEVEHDGEILKGDYIYGMVTNSLSVGGFKNITGKNVAFDDGKFEVMLVRRPATLAEMKDIVLSLLRQTFDAACITTFKSSYIKVKSKETLDWTLDGEYGGSYTEAEIENVQRAVPIIVRK